METNNPLDTKIADIDTEIEVIELTIDESYKAKKDLQGKRRELVKLRDKYNELVLSV